MIDVKKLDVHPPASKQPDEFTEVEDAHVIPRLWLRRFANATDGIQVVLRRGQCTFITNTRKAGTRCRFYSRNRPRTGERIDDIEWSLSQLEGPSAKALRTIETAWPLEVARKATLAQLFGLQVVRGPDWMSYHHGLGSGALTEFATSGSGLEEAAKLVPEGELTPVGDGIIGDTERLIKMNLISAKVAAAFGSMTWTLLERNTDDLAPSDQPVALWPIGEETRLRRSRKMWEIGMVNLLEVRVPVSPRLAVLMTSRDLGDDPELRAITARQAANLNPSQSPALIANGSTYPMRHDQSAGRGHGGRCPDSSSRAIARSLPSSRASARRFIASWRRESGRGSGQSMSTGVQSWRWSSRQGGETGLPLTATGQANDQPGSSWGSGSDSESTQIAQLYFPVVAGFAAKKGAAPAGLIAPQRACGRGSGRTSPDGGTYLAVRPPAWLLIARTGNRRTPIGLAA